MISIGKYNTLSISRFTSQGAYLTYENEEVLLPSRYVDEEWEAGRQLHVFIYKDSEDRKVATRSTPYAQVNEFTCLQVLETNQTGTFLDWGLKKDLLLPYKEQCYQPKQGDKVVVRICLDPRSERLIASSYIESFLEHANEHEVNFNTPYEALVYQITDLGYKVIVDNKWQGLVLKNEANNNLFYGKKATAYIVNLRADGKLDLSLFPKKGKATIEQIKNDILELLDRSNGYLPVHDKSTPEDVFTTLGISKKLFKQAAGNLYKEKIIDIKNDGIYKIKG